MKKTAVLLYPQFSEYELSVALSVLMQGGKPVITCAANECPVKGESGLTAVPDAAFNNINLNEIDSLLLTGCMNVMALHNEAGLFSFLKEAGEVSKVIGSISSSPYLLAKAGLLKDKRYTVGLTKEARAAAGVFEEKNYSDELVVKDGNLITARGRGFIEFGLLFGESLGLDFDGGWYEGK